MTAPEKWRDAYEDSNEREVQDVSNLPSHATIYTVGFLVRKTPLALFVAQDYLPETGPPVPAQARWRTFTIIPRGIVSEIKVLRKGAE